MTDFTDINGVYRDIAGEKGRVDYLYRISLKAIIFNDEGKLLVTDEANRPWHLPGGGLEHGESIEQGLGRELAEEVGYTGKFSYKIIGTEPMWMGDDMKMWQLWVVFLVDVESYEFSNEHAKFIAIEDLLDDSDSQRSYRYAQAAKTLNKEI